MKRSVTNICLIVSILLLNVSGVFPARAATCSLDEEIKASNPQLWLKFDESSGVVNYGTGNASVVIDGGSFPQSVSSPNSNMMPKTLVPSICGYAHEFKANGARYVNGGGFLRSTFEDNEFSIEVVLRISQQSAVTYPAFFNIYNPES